MNRACKTITYAESLSASLRPPIIIKFRLEIANKELNQIKTAEFTLCDTCNSSKARKRLKDEETGMVRLINFHDHLFEPRVATSKLT